MIFIHIFITFIFIYFFWNYNFSYFTSLFSFFHATSKFHGIWRPWEIGRSIFILRWYPRAHFWEYNVFSFLNCAAPAALIGKNWVAMESLGYADSVELIKTVFVAITQKLSLETKMRAGYQQTWTFPTRDWEKISKLGSFPVFCSILNHFPEWKVIEYGIARCLFRFV